MPERLIEIRIPSRNRETLEQILAGLEVERRWTLPAEEGVLIHLLAETGEVEAILDPIESRFGRLDGFHLVVLSTEASLPRPPEPEELEEREKELATSEERADGEAASAEPKAEGLAAKASDAQNERAGAPAADSEATSAPGVDTRARSARGEESASATLGAETERAAPAEDAPGTRRAGTRPSTDPADGDAIAQADGRPAAQATATASSSAPPTPARGDAAQGTSKGSAQGATMGGPRGDEQGGTKSDGTSEKKSDSSAKGSASGKAPKRRRVSRVSREELRRDIGAGVHLDRIFVAMVVLSTIVAVIGLARDSSAVVIGAMVIAPLLGPNMALSLATTLGDRELGRRALKTGGFGLALAFALAMLLGLVWELDPTRTEIAARTHLELSDLVLALASGAAGALAFTTGQGSSLVGVMVAVALLPPMVVFAMLLVGGHPGEALRALILLGVNLICVNLAGVATFLAQGIGPRTWWEAEQTRRASRRALCLWSALLVLAAALILLSQRL